MNVLARWPMLLATCAGAAFATLLPKRYKEKQAHKAELHGWENEGGNVAPSPKASDALVTTGSA